MVLGFWKIIYGSIVTGFQKWTSHVSLSTPKSTSVANFSQVETAPYTNAVAASRLTGGSVSVLISVGK
jgi:hypothetical protein